MKLVVAIAACAALGCASPSAPSDPPAALDAVVDVAGPVDTMGPPDVAPPPEDTAPPAPPPLPKVYGVSEAADENPDPNIVEVTLTAAPVADVELVKGKKTMMWAYNGQIPGPLIHAKLGQRLIVHLENQLTEDTTIHWHGLKLPNAMDGSPMTQEPIKPGASFTYDFMLTHAGTYWYHPHVKSNVQVERGLYGPIVIHEAEPPAFDADRVVFLDDIDLKANGSRAAFSDDHMTVMHGRFGNTLLLNGRDADGEAVVPMRRGAVERWRLLSAANARIAMLDVKGAAWRVIATDGGLVPEPFERNPLVVGPGQRFDIEVRWEPATQADTGELRYWVPTGTADANGNALYDALTLFTMQSTGEAPLPAHDVALPEVVLPDWPAQDDATVIVTLNGEMNGMDLKWTLDGKAFDDMVPVPLGGIQTLDFVNLSGMVHPMHIHGHFFQIVSRNGKPANDPGLRDTYLIGGKETVRMTILFDAPGMWMMHCHILEHAEAGMMGSFMVE